MKYRKSVDLGWIEAETDGRQWRRLNPPRELRDLPGFVLSRFNKDLHECAPGYGLSLSAAAPPPIDKLRRESQPHVSRYFGVVNGSVKPRRNVNSGWTALGETAQHQPSTQPVLNNARTSVESERERVRRRRHGWYITAVVDCGATITSAVVTSEDSLWLRHPDARARFFTDQSSAESFAQRMRERYRESPMFARFEVRMTGDVPQGEILDNVFHLPPLL